MNAGDGRHEHPTQALLDAFTLRRHRGPSLDGCRVAIVGDIRNSRVARSNVKAFHALGCEVTLVGPPTLMPRAARRLAGHGVATTSTTCSPTSTSSTCCASSTSASARRCSRRSASTRRAGASRAERAARLKPDTLVMHPGPMNRGVEIAAEVADSTRSLVTEQVANGVAVRMAVLWSLLGSGGPVV